MADTLNRLTDRGAKALVEPGRYADGGGLYLIVTPKGKSWTLFFFWEGKRKEMGLGPFHTTGLKEAREAARAARVLAAAGTNPIVARKKAALAALPASDRTFKAVMEKLIEHRGAAWKNPRYAKSWRRMVDTHARHLRDMDVAAISAEDVLLVLRPIWTKKQPTAVEVRKRVAMVLDAAKGLGLRTADNPDSALDILLGRPTHRPKHFDAMPYDDIAVLVSKLHDKDHVASLALEFCILTCMRSATILGATWAEIDFAEKLWTIPARRMKGRTGATEDHEVPLSEQALRVLEAAMRATNGAPDEYVFPGGHIGQRKAGTPMAHPTMWNLLKRLLPKGSTATVHGFRSSFSDWAAEQTDYGHDLAETALAHVTGTPVSRAYRRSRLLAKRRQLMDDWGRHVSGQGRPVPPARSASARAA